MKLMVKLSFLLLLSLPSAALAEIPAQLKSDFAPVSGTIIMPVGEEYLVDLDATSNLNEGDILTLIMAGEKIVHPETKEILGTLEQAKGFLQVTQVKSGYSYAKPLSAEIGPVKGAQVKRFVQTPTRFETIEPNSTMASELRLALPHLDWLKPGDTTAPELIFTLNAEDLTVSNSSGATLKTYQYQNGKLIAPFKGLYHAGTFQSSGSSAKKKSLANRAVANLTAAIGIGGKDKRLENPGITQGQQLNDGIWVGPNLDGNPVGIAVADFDGDGKQETAVAIGDHLQILRLTAGKLTPVATVHFSPAIHLLSLDAFDIDDNGQPELYLSANIGTELSSQVVTFSQGSYQNTQSKIPWFFRVIDLPQEGRILFAQIMGDSKSPFAGTPFRVVRDGTQLQQGKELALPTRLNLFSAIPFRGHDNDLLYASLSAEDYLFVNTPSGTELWESDDHFGGTEVLFYNEKDNLKELLQPVFIQQRLLTLPSGEILSAQNDGMRALERYRNFSKSRVIAFKWDGFALQRSWQTVDQNGYLADFTLADADNDGEIELVMVVKYQHQSLISKGRTSVVIYELK